MKVKCFNIYEVNGGNKVPLLSTAPTTDTDMTIEEIDEAVGQLLELFYSYDKIKLTNKEGNGFIVRGGDTKTFIIEAEIEAEKE